ncbi:hypothetical protein Y032_0604g550 [Ancylostoma ceylanicum]|uniref:Uncharacterized protein n=1 Tax=Ancylostoma ceylanicum TaxID=53326 RepID=A0A016WLD6_9BILA|nr:hypothetical protein Y032_0604g550 [Ancylostoma ceylanicum]
MRRMRKISAPTQISGQKLPEEIHGGVNTSFLRPSPAGDTPQEGWPGRDMHTAPDVASGMECDCGRPIK